jgi:hypothetical protein
MKWEFVLPPTQDLPFPAPSDVVQRYRETAVGHSGRWERHRPAEMAQCGEIDVMEHYGQKPTTAFGTIHGPAMTVMRTWTTNPGPIHRALHPTGTRIPYL